MGETVKLIFSLSVSGGMFALVLFALKPFMRNRLSKSFQYYIWIVVLLRFILPFSFGINLMDYTFNTPNTPQAAEETIVPNKNPANQANINPAINNNPVNNNEPIITEQQPLMPVSTDSAKPSDVIRTLSDNLLWIWLSGFVLSAAFNILGYLRFIRYVHGAAYAVEIPDCTAAVYKSCFAPTPMLIGVIRARIYLPDIEYLDGQLNNILLHELTHLRRHDIWLKWFAALVASVHWFNPIVYFMRREFNCACELSCDEAVIRNLDGAAKQSYGDTLISVVAESRSPVRVMSVTMCEEKKKLEERLIAIMNYKKKTKIAVLITVVLAVMLTCSAFAFGANAVGVTQPEKALTSAMDTMNIGLKTYYLVETETQLRSIAQSDAVLSRNYLQNADIVLENEWVSIGSDEHPFTGSYNGNGFSIIGLRYPAGEKKVTGLFGYTEGATIYNVTLDKLDITNANGLHSGAIVAVGNGGNFYDNRILSVVQFESESIVLAEEVNITPPVTHELSNPNYEFISYNTREEGDELLLITHNNNNMTEADLREQLIKNAVPNQAKNIKTISATGIEKLLINAELCGIVVETIEGSEYTIDYIGVQNKTSISVSTSIENGALSVSAQGSGNGDRLVSTVRGSRINVVRIGVPKNSVKEINVQNEVYGCIMIDGVDVPVNGNAGKGLVRAQSETLIADINLEASSGFVIVKGNVISSNIAMTVANGSAYVEGDAVDGNLHLTASNGDVNVIAGSLKNGEFTATNGEVNLTIGTIIQKVSAKVSNGEMVIQLLEKPTNLRYVQTDKSNADISLPYGWKDGYQVGNGSALLKVSVGNGDYSLTVKQ